LEAEPLNALARADLYFQLHSHAYLFEDPNEHEEEEAKMDIKTAVASLCVITVITSFCADYRSCRYFSISLS
jgi:Ca2+/H+ antiporter